MTPSVTRLDSPGATEPDPEEHARAATYSWLAALLRCAPDEAVLDELRAVSERDSAPATGLPGAWAMLRLAAEDADVAKVDTEFHELFIGLGRGELVPFGSWYLTGFLLERPLSRLRRDLQVLGFERRGDVHEPEDHVSALFEVMAMLVSDPNAPFDLQQKFFSDHIENWVGRFFADLEAARAATFYRAVGRLASEFVKVEKDGLAMLV